MVGLLTTNNANTVPMPDNTQPPPQLNPNAMNNQIAGLKNNGMATSQSVTKAAQNPQNKFYAKGGATVPPKATESPYKDFFDTARERYAPAGMQPAMAKGGAVSDAPFKEALDAVAAHPSLLAQNAENDSETDTTPTKGKKPMKGEARQSGKGLLSSNDDVGFARGGTVNMSDSKPDSMTDFQGQPNVDGDPTQDYNQQGLLSYAKGGQDEAPPGALKDEVADNVDAKLSPGEFVFSADATRYYGLNFLTQMMDHARQQLAKMNGEGDIRSPGDGQNDDQDGGQFMQDGPPDTQAYSQADNGNQAAALEQNAASGLLGKGQEPPKMATGGGLGEEESLAKGGVVSPTASSLTPKGMENGIPTGNMKMAGMPKMPKAIGTGTIKTPNNKGLLAQLKNTVTQGT